MKTPALPNAAPLLLAAILAVAPNGCGDGTLNYGGSLEETADTVTLRGNIDDVVPVTTGRDIQVFVYVNMVDSTAFLANPENYSSFDDGEAATVDPVTSEFSVGNLSSGNLTVFFLLDEAQADGEINTGDTDVALLADPNQDLTNIYGGQTMVLENVDLDFTDSPVASADNITSG